MKLKRKLLLIGPKTGDTIMGVTIAFDMLSNYLREINGQIHEVNLTQRGSTGSAGRFRIGRTFFTLARVIEAWFKMLFVSQVYLIVSTSKFGFVKDFLIIHAARLLNKNIVIHLHGGGYLAFYNERSSVGKWIVRFTLLRTNRIIVLGELLRTQFDFLNNPKLISVVPNGLSPPTDSLTKVAAKNAPDDDEPWRILYLSNLMETKGYFVLLEACQILADSRHKLQVDFCGGFVESIAETGGPSRAAELKDDFLRRIKSSPLNQFVNYHGTVYGEAKNKLLQSAHALVLPTIYPWEGQPLSIIEAMSCGTLVISTEHAGIPEQIIEGKTGWMLKNNSIDASHLADQLSVLMSLSNETFQSMSQQAISLYLDRFTLQHHLNNLLSSINEA